MILCCAASSRSHESRPASCEPERQRTRRTRFRPVRWQGPAAYSPDAGFPCPSSSRDIPGGCDSRSVDGNRSSQDLLDGLTGCPISHTRNNLMRIACLGECMVELSHLRDGSLELSYGGDTLNTASRLGVDVGYVTALGDDPYSDEMISKWQDEGVDTRCREWRPSEVMQARALLAGRGSLPRRTCGRKIGRRSRTKR